MTERKFEQGKTEIDDQKIADLLRIAGRRPDIDAERQARVYAKTLDAWQAAQARPAADRVYGSVLATWQHRASWLRWRGWLMPAAVAASVLLAFIIVMEPAPAPRAVAGVVNRVVADAGTETPYVADQDVLVGDTIETAPGVRMSLLLASGESIRIDGDTRLRLTGRHSSTLDRGRVYADTGDFVYRHGALEIDTPFGSVTDIGTQFAVSVTTDRLDVAVREGRVDVSQAGAEHVAIAGERILLAGNGNPERQSVAPTGEFWNWATEIAPVFDIEDRSLLDFLKWVSRETGLELVFPANDARVAAMRTDLHGSVTDLTPREALDAVLATTAYTYRIEGDRLIIER